MRWLISIFMRDARPSKTGTAGHRCTREIPPLPFMPSPTNVLIRLGDKWSAFFLVHCSDVDIEKQEVTLLIDHTSASGGEGEDGVPLLDAELTKWMISESWDIGPLIDESDDILNDVNLSSDSFHGGIFGGNEDEPL